MVNDEDERGDEPLEIMEAIAEEIQQNEEYESEDALDTFEAYAVVRRKLQEKKMSRGFKNVDSRSDQGWKLNGTIKAKIESIKARTKCHRCNRIGHWKKECPLHGSSQAASSSKGKEQEGGKEVHIIESEMFMVEPENDIEMRSPVTWEKEVMPKSKTRRDNWRIDHHPERLVRVHVKPRKGMFTPHGVADIPMDDENLSGRRERETTMLMSDGTREVVNDNYHTAKVPHQKTKGTWTGETAFFMKGDESEERQGQVADHDAMIVGYEREVLRAVKSEGAGPEVFESFSVEHSVTADLDEHAVPDTACRKTLVGEYTLRGMEAKLNSRGLRVRRRKEVNEFRFGNAGTLISSEVALIPVTIGRSRLIVHAAVLPGTGQHTPFLLSKELLRGLDCVLDMSDDVANFRKINEKVKMKVTQRGHYAIPVLEETLDTFSGEPCNSQRCGNGDVSIGHGADPGSQVEQRSHRGDLCEDSPRCSGRQSLGREGLSDSWHRVCRSRKVFQRKGHQDDLPRGLREGQGIHPVDSQSRGHQEVISGNEEIPPVRRVQGQSEEGETATPVEHKQPGQGPDAQATIYAYEDVQKSRGSREPSPRKRGLRVVKSGLRQGHGHRRMGQDLRGNSDTGADPSHGNGGEGTARGIHAATQEHGRPGQEQEARGLGSEHEGSSSLSEEEKDFLSRSLDELNATSLEAPGNRIDVMFISLDEKMRDADVAEVFSVPRVCKAAKAMGLNCGGSFDLKTGYDLLDKKVRNEVRDKLRQLKPRLVVICPPCGPYSPLQDLSKHKNMKVFLRKLYQGRILLRFGMDIAQDQLDRGDLFVFEHPRRAKSWHDRRVQEIGAQEGVIHEDLDQCAYGLKDRISGRYHQKTTGIMTNSPELAEKLKRRCSHDHEHEHILGSIRMPEGWRSRSSLAQEYPKGLVNAMIKGLMLDKEKRKQDAVSHCVLTVEALDTQDDKAIMRMLRRCHENLGHPSRQRFIAMLRAARANEKCLELAKTLKCTTCDESTREKSHNVSRSIKDLEFNDLVCADTFEVELPWRKLKLLNLIDVASRYQVCVPLWKGLEVKKVRDAYRRYWKRWAGPPKTLLTDGGPEFSTQLTDHLSYDGTEHELTAAHAPWQNGICERAGGSWKNAFEKAMLETDPKSKQEVEELLDNINHAHNQFIRYDGHSPMQHVLGRDVYIPGMNTCDSRDDQLMSALEVGESRYEKSQRIRLAARKAFMEAESEAKVKRAISHRTRPNRGPFMAGDAVMMWRRAQQERKHHWHGPGRVIGSQQNKVWVAYGSKIYRCAPEQVRHQTSEVQELSEWIPINLKKFKDSVRERGAGNVVELDKGDFPPEDQVERRQAPGESENRVGPNENDGDLGDVDMNNHDHEHDHEAGQGSNTSDRLTGNEDMDTQSKTSLGYSPSDGEPFVEDQSMEPSVDNTGNHDGGSSGQGSGHVVGHVGHGNSHVVVGHDGGGQSSENQGYGPIRQTPLTQALRRSLDNLDFGRPRLPQRPEDVDETLLSEEVFAVNLKKQGTCTCQTHAELYQINYSETAFYNRKLARYILIAVKHASKKS